MLQDLAVAAGLVSHPGVKPTFKGSGNPGNFEPAAATKISGSNAPGENGRAHKLSASLRQESTYMPNIDLSSKDIWSIFSKVHLLTKWTRFAKSLCSDIDLDFQSLFSGKGPTFGYQSDL